MSCKEVCHRYKAAKPGKANIRYAVDPKRCTTCDVFMKWDGPRCPCCAITFRSNPKNAAGRKKMMIVNDEKRI